MLAEVPFKGGPVPDVRPIDVFETLQRGNQGVFDCLFCRLLLGGHCFVCILCQRPDGPIDVHAFGRGQPQFQERG